MKRKIELPTLVDLKRKAIADESLNPIEALVDECLQMNIRDIIQSALQQAYDQGYEDAESARCGIKKALKDLIQDLEQRSTWKEGRDKGVVDCGNGVYMQAKRALGDFK